MRDDRIDILRFIGLAMIIFAHVDPPELLFQLRNFDVPLMVLVSAMSFGLSYKSSESYSSYVWKRIKRLVFPVWIFLTGYFIALLVFNPGSDELEPSTLINTYTLLHGIGYVWIIRVFLLVALASPFIFSWHQKTQNNGKYFLTLTIFFLIYELLRYLSLPLIQQGTGELVSAAVLYIIPYGIIFAIGLRMGQLNKRQLQFINLLSLVTFTLIALWLLIRNGQFMPTQEFKYPPSIYYLSYALFISSLLWIYSQGIDHLFQQLKLKKLVLFIASNSIWVYLWHIPLIKYIHTHLALKFVIAFSGAVLITYLQTLLINYWLKHIHSAEVKKNIKMLLTG